MTLNELKTGNNAVVQSIQGEESLRRHLLDMGLIPGTEITLLKYAPLGDPMEIKLRGYNLSLRRSEASRITVKPLSKTAETENGNADSDLSSADWCEHNSHPGLGEAGKFHSKEDENELPKGTKITFALAGQQNSGKTTLFNQLTGAKQHVGNFPGVTVERKEGTLRGHSNAAIVDLPGIYSLSPYSEEEKVTKNYLLQDKPTGIINIVDASNIERNLYLTMQLMELDIPMVLALNMMDEVQSNGGTIRVNEMERILGIPVVPISAAKNEGVSELVEHAMHVAQYQERPLRQDFCDKEDGNGAVHRCLHSIMHLIEDHALRAQIPLRFAANKLVEGDDEILETLQLNTNEKEMLEHIILQMEEERGMDRVSAIADMRFLFIRRLCAQTVVRKSSETKEGVRSRKIDKVFTGRWSALPIFIVTMCAVIWLSIDVLGAPLQDLFDQGITWLSGICEKAMTKAAVNSAIISLVRDGIFSGVGSVISFLPIILILFLFLSLIEDSGYMARIAFISDKLLRKIGLSGRSIVPLLIGFGCSVPAVMATRTLPSARDRVKTILLTPFMSCSAKIPIYAFFTSTFFPGHGGVILVGLYLFSIFIGVLIALITKRLKRGQEAVPFVMELPNYRLPSLKNTFHLLWSKMKDFVQKAFTVIFVATIIIWFLQSFNFQFQMVENGEGSILAKIAGFIAPLFYPAGLNDWRVVTSLISGFLAKESVVATMGVLDVTSAMTTASAAAMLVFSLLYTPCVAAIAVIRRELGWKWALFVVFFQCFVAWVCAVAIYGIFNLL